MTNKEAAIRVVRHLRRNGFEALLAGGCVRDMLLGQRPKDFDVATNALPKNVMQLFHRTLKVGARFGVVIVLTDGRQTEVATFRTETGYIDGRHPGKVEFSDAVEDARRRDFTINGMFYDPATKRVIDFVGGQEDLARGIIRTIGAPEERFSEDYLRMLRAVRFSTRFGFEIEPGTQAVIRKDAKNITRISGERIATELEEMLVHPNRSAGLSLLIQSGLAEVIFPDFSGEGAASAVGILSCLPRRIDFGLGLAGLFAGFSTEFALERCEMLKLSRNQMKQIKFLLSNRGVLVHEEMSLAKLKMLLAEPFFEGLYQLEKAIRKAVGGQKAVGPLLKLRRRIKALGDVEVKPKPILNGHDLVRLGAVPGPGLGQLAQEMYIAQLEGDIQTVEDAKVWVQKWLDRHKEIG
jgi:tRNA nucleotidyltransferase/poly(A) polymerase